MNGIIDFIFNDSFNEIKRIAIGRKIDIIAITSM